VLKYKALHKDGEAIFSKGVAPPNCAWTGVGYNLGANLGMYNFQIYKGVARVAGTSVCCVCGIY
jgi:hypothetical protein